MNEPHELHEDESNQDLAELRAIIEEYDDEADECTIFPSDVPNDRETTTWISAKAGSFVALDDQQ
ncbi:DUF7511 domain-containing protein [Natranaeroarchaeum aerophilus]|uniref:DUF7511 domain-containing protein n=1 Tax=Natranaeroarchaeum aerophilus TaxID=2917711 RepID=A0AAE3K4E9_9EURY|nr:hypothetical protein [Natranaeroarchaeum aerophilus]MCL9813101.1 hypothetical protein [Natranaeroarchaeum aerophilus]